MDKKHNRIGRLAKDLVLVLMKIALPSPARNAVFRRYAYYTSAGPAKSCHLDSLFINHEGFVYPCCRVWQLKSLEIGHINDGDLIEKILKFNKSCSCHIAKLRPASPQESIRGLNIEVSLACQGKCAMCCVHAPDWHGNYDYYDALKRFIIAAQPKTIHVQGGEVLIQKKTINWLGDIKDIKPDIELTLATNGNAEADMVPMVNKLFNAVYMSIVGFQPETYKRVMGLDIDKTKHFIEKLVSTNVVKLQLKFMSTAINIHEAGLFFDWAVKLHRVDIAFADTSVKMYLNFKTFDNYWNKILLRTAEDLKRRIVEAKPFLLSAKRKVYLDVGMRDLFNITPAWIRENNLDEIIFDCS